MSNLSLAVKKCIKGACFKLKHAEALLSGGGVVGNVYLGNIDWSCKEIG